MAKKTLQEYDQQLRNVACELLDVLNKGEQLDTVKLVRIATTLADCSFVFNELVTFIEETAVRQIKEKEGIL